MNSARDLQLARLQLADVTAGRLTLGRRLYILSNPMATGLRGRGWSRLTERKNETGGRLVARLAEGF